MADDPAPAPQESKPRLTGERAPQTILEAEFGGVHNHRPSAPIPASPQNIIRPQQPKQDKPQK